MKGVYKLTFPNGKAYIGSSVNIKVRWANGKGYDFDNAPVGKAIQEYGWENVNKEILYVSDDIEELHLMEGIYIEKYRTTDPEFGYNMMGKDGNINAISDALRVKFSEGMKEYHKRIKENPNDYRASLTNPDYIPKKMQAHLRNTGRCKSGKDHWNYGKTVPEERRRIISEKLKGRPSPPKIGLYKTVIKFEKETHVEICRYDSLRDAALSIENKCFATVKSSISACCHRKVPSAYGYVWRFKNDTED